MTQIIERVARAMYNREHKATPWELVKPTLRQDYINLAQAALKEIKFDELVGALSDLVGVINDAHICDLQDKEDRHGIIEFTYRAETILSELEKTGGLAGKDT